MTDPTAPTPTPAKTQISESKPASTSAGKSKGKTTSTSKRRTRRKVTPKDVRPPTHPTPTPATPRGSEPDPVGVGIFVDNKTRRSDEDALQNSFVDVVSGKHQGRYGSFTDVLSYGRDRYPKKVVVFTRDENADRLEVDYSDIRPSKLRASGGR